MQTGNGNGEVITREDFIARHGVTAWEELVEPLQGKSLADEEQPPDFVHGIIRKFLEERRLSTSCLLDLRDEKNGACTPLYNLALNTIEEMIRKSIQ